MGVGHRKHLNDLGETLLDHLKEGRACPAYCRSRLIDEGRYERISSTFILQCLQRLKEHGHVQSLYNVGLYQLDNDPREDTGE